MSDVFPNGAFLKGEITPVTDFTTKEQQLDKDTGLRLWQAQIVDPDPEAGKRETAITVKIAAPVQPVPPHNDTPFPFTPVEFENLTALPWIDDSGPRPRITWSYRATGIKAPEGKPAGRRHQHNPEQPAA